jgi:hypothetical protein
MVVILHVAEHQRGTRQPRQTAQRGHVRLEHEVAVALLPARGLVAGHRFHIDVGPRADNRRLWVSSWPPFDEELAVEPLAHEPALHVDTMHTSTVSISPLATAVFSVSKSSIPVMPSPR